MAEGSKDALDCKTLFLKVSIHCEGCKKKVKRVLQSMPEVYKVEIDSFQHKVAVTCNVDHETLIRKLQKSGKQASAWPEAKKPGGGNQTPNTSSDNKNQNNESNSKQKDKEPKEGSEKPEEIPPEQANKEKSSDKGVEKEKEKEKPKTEEETKSKPQEKEKEKEKDKEKDVVKEKPKEKEEKAKEQTEQEAKQNGSSESKKETKEEKEKKNESSGNVRGQHVERGISAPQPNQDFMNPYSYPYPPQPIMSYHMAQPSSSQAFYQQPPMPGTQGYMYPYQHPYPYPYQYPYGAPSEFSYGTTESSTRGDDTLNYFNEENVNSCSVM